MIRNNNDECHSPSGISICKIRKIEVELMRTLNKVQKVLLRHVNETQERRR